MTRVQKAEESTKNIKDRGFIGKCLSMSQKNRSRKNNKTNGAMEPHADVIRDPSAQEDTTTDSVTTAASTEADKTGNENAEGASRLSLIHI